MTTGALWDLIGRTMLHTLWVGSLIGLAAGAGRLAMRKRSAGARYVHALASLIVLGLSPLAIAWGLAPETKMRQPAVAPAAPSIGIPSTTTLAFVPMAPSPPPAAVRPIPASQLDAIIPLLPYVWLEGTPLTFAVLAFGMIGAERLRRRATLLHDHPIGARCRAISEGLELSRAVLVGVCDRVAGPVLIGVIRPMILLPTSALSGWTPEEVEFALLHELIHAKRGDNLVQLMQSLIESFLFFHPAAWLISGWVRRDREHCCDLAVVARTGRAVDYARALLSLSGHPSPPTRIGLAMARHPIVARIHHLLGHTEEPMRHGTVSRMWIGSAIALLLAPALLALAQALPSRPTPDPARERTLQALEAAARDPNSGDTSQLVQTLINLARARAQSGQVGRAKELLALAADIAAKGKQTVTILEPAPYTRLHGDKLEGQVQPDPEKPGARPKADAKAEDSGLVVTARPMGGGTTFVKSLGSLKPSVTTAYGPSPRDLLCSIAQEQSRLGDRQVAIDTLELAIRTGDSREDLLASRLTTWAWLAGLYRMFGRSDRARAVAEEFEQQAIPTPMEPLSVWVPHIVHAYCAAGDWKRGFAYLDRTLADAPSESEKEGMLANTIAHLCLELQERPDLLDPGFLPEAQRRVEAAKGTYTNMHSFGLAMCLASRGQIDQALRIADSAPKAYWGGFRPQKWHVSILEHAANTCRLRGDSDLAIVLRERAIRESARVKDSPLTSTLLAAQLLATKDVAKVAAVVPSVRPGYRWQILALISRFQKERGQADAAKESLADALADVDRIVEPAEQARLKEVGLDLPKADWEGMAASNRLQVIAIAGDLAQSKKAAEGLGWYSQTQVVNSILWSMTRAGDAEGALAWLKSAKLDERIRRDGPAEVARLLVDPDGFR